MLIAIAILFACFFAMNIGASGTAAAMGAAYGGGAIKKRKVAVLLVGIVALIGAILGGGKVTKTISSGIIPADIINVNIAILIIASSGIVLFISNKMSVPLSTSEVTVGSIIGVGLIYQKIYIKEILIIVSIWFLLPLIAYWIAKLLGKGVHIFEKKWLYQYKNNPWYIRILSACLVFFGCYEAFAAGMNNVANAIGPLVSAHLVSTEAGLWIGATFLSMGAIFLGGPVLETNGKGITKMSLMQGSVVSFTSGSLVIVASFFGIPVPLTQATTMSIIGVGACNEQQTSIWKRPIVRKILFVWIVSPLASMVTTYSLINLFIFESPYMALILVMGLFYAFIYKTYRVGDIINVMKK